MAMIASDRLANAERAFMSALAEAPLSRTDAELAAQLFRDARLARVLVTAVLEADDAWMSEHIARAMLPSMTQEGRF